ncbi:MAG: class I SAM-dependent RNA methyltransferase [Gammaproteobacteria bacterium]|nr:class I SAM-dependent RNA methyltransferase [Gammaproteobacteria bacterium]
MSMFTVFIPCPRGLENVLADEMAALGITEVKPYDGGVGGSASPEQVAEANLWLRTATRVTVVLNEGECNHIKQLYDMAFQVRWDDWFQCSQTFRVDANVDKRCGESREFVNLKVKDAVVDRFRQARGERPSIDKRDPHARVRVHWVDGYARIMLDTSGEPLFKRGWRGGTGEAPLRENLAAGLLLLAGYDGSTPFFDPMCGSGTLLVEAADIAANLPPGRYRQFAYKRLLPLQDVRVQRYESRPIEQLITGNDRDSHVIRHARQNLRNADYDDIVLTSMELSDLDAPANSGILVTNPPYGERLEDLQTISRSYPAWGTWLKQKMPGWQTFWLTADRAMPKGMGLSPKRKTPLFNGALECRLFSIPMVSGSARGQSARESMRPE